LALSGGADRRLNPLWSDQLWLGLAIARVHVFMSSRFLHSAYFVLPKVYLFLRTKMKYRFVLHSVHEKLSKFNLDVYVH
jgi:hypothetical protein